MTSTALAELPGYPCDNAAFAVQHVQGIPDDVLADATALRAELDSRVASLTPELVASLQPLSPQTHMLCLWVWLNQVYHGQFNA